MTSYLTAVALLMLQLGGTFADVFFHNPRGSNNRLDGRKQAVTNNNRLFDSQNNNNAGYNVGNLYYYSGSKLSVEWTTQHSCGDANSHCQLILQYMCDSHVRDGAVVNTIPVNSAECSKQDCTIDLKYGMHEDFYYYSTCALRQRNQNLFTADQKPKNRAIHTRQNPNGKRRGYECPEERDYYPYWHPSPWRDIAVMTNDATKCPYYQAESENVKGRWACVVPQDVMRQEAVHGLTIPNNEEQCLKFRWPPTDPNGVRAEWKEFPPHGIEAPVCQETQFTRDNHLGNGLGGYPNLYNWTLPELNEDRCILRIRYNISTNDYVDADASNNARRKGGKTSVNLHTKYGFTNENAASERGWVFKNNPQVQLFSDLPGFKLSLAINTAQFGRVFQDRSHVFAIKQRPEELKNEHIHNLNIRGKRGNIVQVYPSVEYDFVPNTLDVMKGEYVHFQWTGSNKNPLKSVGEGIPGTDRSNVLLLASQIYPGHDITGVMQFGHWGRNYPAHLNSSSFLGFSNGDRKMLALLIPNNIGSQMALLDDAGTYFDLEPRKVTETGSFHYLCTRNNRFSIRSQKGRIISLDTIFVEKSIGWNGGSVTLPHGAGSVQVKQGDFDRLHLLRMEQWTKEQGEQRMTAVNRKFTIAGDYASDFFIVLPETQLTVSGRQIQVKIKVWKSSVQMYHSTTHSFSTWTNIDSHVTDGFATFTIESGGIFIAMSHSNTSQTVGIVLGVLALFVVLAGAACIYRRYNPNILNVIRRSLHHRV